MDHCRIVICRNFYSVDGPGDPSSCYAVDVQGIAANIGFSRIDFGGFFRSYTAGNIPGGILADRLKPHQTFTLEALWWSVSCIITGLAKGFYGLLGARILLGAGEGPDFATED